MSANISKIHYRNFAVIPNFDLAKTSGINLVIGANATGKTFFLKSLYTAVKTLEEYRRGDNARTISDILSERLRWTFQGDRIGDIVTRGCSDALEFQMNLDGIDFSYSFSQSTATKVSAVTSATENRPANSIFIPAGDVLSLYSVILKSRERDRSFGFDDTYYDLAKALRIAPKKGQNLKAFSAAGKSLSDIISGKTVFDETNDRWYYKDDKNFRYSIGAASAGAKRIAILDRLLANGYLTASSSVSTSSSVNASYAGSASSVVFIDDIESELHPDALCSFLDVISSIAMQTGMQFFVSSNSYFAVKKLALIARKHKGLVTCISLGKDRNQVPDVCDLHDGIPDNSIIDTSVKLYDEEITETFND